MPYVKNRKGNLLGCFIGVYKNLLLSFLQVNSEFLGDSRKNQCCKNFPLTIWKGYKSYFLTKSSF